MCLFCFLTKLTDAFLSDLIDIIRIGIYETEYEGKVFIMKSLTKSKRFLAGLVGTAMIFSLSGCGGKQEDFADYGTIQGEADSEQSVEENSKEGTEAQATTAADTISDEVSYSNISWAEKDLTIKGLPAKAEIGEKSFDTGDRHVYEGTNVDDFSKSETRIVQALFGDTAKKIEKLSYTDETSYMPFLYKYRRLKGQLDHSIDYTKISEVQTPYFENQKAINSSFDETYEWVDNEDCSIHMYEGTYKSKKFGLILAYDKEMYTRYIFFHPISVDEYFPGSNYKTLNICYAADQLEETKNLTNKCEYSIDDVKEMASDFLCNNLDFNQKYLSFTDNGTTYTSMVWPVGEVYASNDDYSGIGGKEEYEEAVDRKENKASLIFTDADCVSTSKNNGSAVANAGYYRLTSQDYELKDGEFFDQAVSLSENKEATINYDVDGYAVFLNCPYSGFSPEIVNVGAILVTSNGLYCIDVIQNSNITGIGEEVTLRSFDNIKECFLEGVEKELDLGKMNNPESLNIADASYISNIEYYGIDIDNDGKNKDDDEEDNEVGPNSEFKLVPGWCFTVCGDKNYNADIYINASDGRIEDILYYETNFSY